MAKNQIGAYQQQQKRSLSPREVEAMAFTKAAVLMEDVKPNNKDINAWAQALRFNHLLWTIIQADISEPENTLPPELKANIMSLSIFVDKQTTKALRSSNPDDLNVLININRNLAAGLRENPGDASPAPSGSSGSVETA